MGTAGDCYSWNSCEEVRNGDFKIDLSGIADIDYSRTGQWKGQGFGHFYEMILVLKFSYEKKDEI